MKVRDPQILYMVLIVPCIFGFTLIGEGINRVMHEETGGVLSIVLGLLFISFVAFVFFFFSAIQ